MNNIFPALYKVLVVDELFARLLVYNGPHFFLIDFSNTAWYYFLSFRELIMVYHKVFSNLFLIFIMDVL